MIRKKEEVNEPPKRIGAPLRDPEHVAQTPKNKRAKSKELANTKYFPSRPMMIINVHTSAPSIVGLKNGVGS